MFYGDLSIGLEFDKTMDSPFSYVCGSCSRCCEGKAIRIGPYEILRMARALGITTTEFVSQNTQSGGTTLLLGNDGNCAFLGSEGCTIHKDRPLACRLYPLGMQIDEIGNKLFCFLHSHPDTMGRFGMMGTISDYLGTQDVDPYFEANDIYEKLYEEMVVALSKFNAKELSRRQERRRKIDSMKEGSLAASWMDIDQTLKLEQGIEYNFVEIVKKHADAVRNLMKESFPT